MTAQTTAAASDTTTFTVESFRHPQGCRGYLVADPESGDALAVDVHLDLVDEVAARVQGEGWTLRFVLDTHTHADHPSGSAALADRLGATRVAHADGHHKGVTHHPADGEELDLGARHVTVRHAPGHTPDHLVLLTGGALLAGDTLLIGSVARTDFLGGDAGQLYDSIHDLLADLDDDTVLFPGHDYEGRERSTLGAERAGNPWLAMEKDEFVRQLAANPPARPANMDDLLRLNREGIDIPTSISATEAVQHVVGGGATSVIDVRTGVEYDGEHVPGSRLVPLDRLEQRLDDVRAAPAPRLLLCRSGGRAETARRTLAELHVGGLTVVEGGIEAYARAGGETEKGRALMSIERQVRVIAGVLVLLGLVLGAFVHAGFLLFAAIVGAGQVFAGLTDWCGMGLLLARAPWNRTASESPAGAPSACAANAPAACGASAPSSCAASPTPESD